LSDSRAALVFPDQLRQLGEVCREPPRFIAVFTTY